MNTETIKCPVCKVKIAGAGHDNMKKNVTLHLINEHGLTFESIVWTGYTVEVVEELVVEEPIVEEPVVEEPVVEEPVVEEPVVEVTYEEMSKKELNILVIKKGLDSKIKSTWNKSKIIKTLKRLQK